MAPRVAPHTASRAAYVGLALATIALGLAIHLGGRRVLPPAVRDPLGDACWAAMMLWWVSALAPRRPLRWRAAATLAVCAAVEVAQLVRHPTLDAVRATALGHLVLGSDFDARDLAAYAAGVLAALPLAAFVARRLARGAAIR